MAHALAADLDELEHDRAPVTVEKARAALNRLARYLQTLWAIDATEVLIAERLALMARRPPPPRRAGRHDA
jgi:hypothetical protein